jgi:hypothetical protein
MPTIQDRKHTRKGRIYQIEGRDYPSVTNILGVISKPALINWAAKVEREMTIEVSCGLYQDAMSLPTKLSATAWITSLNDRLGKTKASQRELAKASEVGSQAHALIEWTLKAKMLQQPGPAPKICDKATWSFMAWEDWANSVHLKPLFVEQVVYSEKYGYAGTLDLLAEVNGKLTVLDWKTGKAVYSEAHLQNAAYRQAIREMGHGDPVQGIIVRLPKVETDPAFEAVDALPEEECFQTFLQFFEGWKWTTKMDKWKSAEDEVAA